MSNIVRWSGALFLVMLFLSGPFLFLERGPDYPTELTILEGVEVSERKGVVISYIVLGKPEAVTERLVADLAVGRGWDVLPSDYTDEHSTIIYNKEWSAEVFSRDRGTRGRPATLIQVIKRLADMPWPP